MGKFRRSVFSFPRVIWFIPRTLLVWILPYFFFPFYLVDWRSWSEAPSKIESISCVYFWDESRALTPCEIVRDIRQCGCCVVLPTGTCAGSRRDDQERAVTQKRHENRLDCVGNK